MERKTYPLDWRKELLRLQPYLLGQPGVVRVVFDSDDCAPREFREVMKSLYENKPDTKSWKSIRIDRHWHSTRRIDEILHQFDLKLGEAGYPPTLKQERSKVANVLVDNEFHGDAEINIENLSIFGTASPTERDRRVKDVCERTRKFMSAGGHMMVTLNPAPAGDQNEFWLHFWRGGLSSLIEAGLVFIHMVDRALGRLHDEAPLPDLEIDLPDRLDEERQDHAYDDLIDVLLKEIPDLSPDRAAGAAVGYVSANGENVRRLHDNLWKLFVQLGQRLNLNGS